ncbi:MAG: universal stress protein [Burkholderiaceae bacterium]|nr:universal stress protein [Burkholderiaceae bacterium]
MYKKILIVVTSNPASRAAVVEGVALAKAHNAEALFFSVLPRYIVPVADMPMVGMLTPDEFRREATVNAQRYLAAATVVADKAGLRSKHAVGAGPDDAKCIVEAARKRRSGLIVVASSGRNAVMRLLAGSVIPGLITHSTIPVLVVRQAGSTQKAEQPAPVPPRPRPIPRKAEAPVRARRRTAA